MKRYFMSVHPELGLDAHEHNQGEWVKYEDAKFELMIKNARVQQLERYIEDCCPINKEIE